MGKDFHHADPAREEHSDVTRDLLPLLPSKANHHLTLKHAKASNLWRAPSRAGSFQLMLQRDA